MGLSDFIAGHPEPILVDCEAFARTLLPAAGGLGTVELRDHARQVLETIAGDMRQPQSPREQHDKARKGRPGPADGEPSAAQMRGTRRTTAGFTITQTIAEFRALRASVIRQWLETSPSLGRDEVFELLRFNEAMDQALAESLLDFAEGAAHRRNLFLGVLSHELRTPLATISASVQSMLLAGRRGQPMPQAAERVLRGSRRIASVLDDLLDYVRCGLGQGMRVVPQEADFGVVCRRVASELGEIYPGQHIRSMVDDDDLAGTFDPQRIAEAVSNLLGNALRHGGDRPVELTVSASDDTVTIRVRNWGPLIPVEVLASLFEPLVRGAGSDHSGVNLGLGLFIVREIARAHGGSVAAESSDKQGTAFQIRVPRRARVPEDAALWGLDFS